MKRRNPFNRKEAQEFVDWMNKVLRHYGQCLDALTEIRDIARVSEGVEFYAMLAQKALDGEDAPD
jgi:hypothetical protein